jgi:hypothetical protein
MGSLRRLGTSAPLHATSRTNPSGSRRLFPWRTNANHRTPLPSAAKQLFNALDNDGSLRAWEHTHKCQNTRPWDGPMPPFDVGTDGAIFRLSAYENSRKDLTREFEHRMPAMITFVNDWLCIHKPEKKHRCALTAKSYFLQEAEGLSRQAKIDWAYSPCIIQMQRRHCDQSSTRWHHHEARSPHNACTCMCRAHPRMYGHTRVSSASGRETS